MKRNHDKYEVVSKLPSNAMTVANYANNKGYTTNYVYNLIRDNKHTDKFKIVVFNTFNFIIPK